MKVYLIIKEDGEWDSWHPINLYAYSSEEAAEVEMARLIAEDIVFRPKIAAACSEWEEVIIPEIEKRYPTICGLAGYETDNKVWDAYHQEWDVACSALVEKHRLPISPFDYEEPTFKIEEIELR